MSADAGARALKPSATDIPAAAPAEETATTDGLTRDTHRLRPVAPSCLAPPNGWTDGWLVAADARLLFVAGQTAADEHGHVASADFATQFEVALSRCLRVVAEAGGQPEHIVRMTVYVTDVPGYIAARRAIGTTWRAQMGRHYPAMALFEVARLVESEAKVEIEVTAALPPGE